jgi:flagellar hook-length control protein FliK
VRCLARFFTARASTHTDPQGLQDWHVACNFTGMNATPPVSQPQRSNDALSLNAPASTGSQAAQANSQDFAGALNDAGARPARKNTTGKPQDADSSGGQLPPPGNQPPLAVAPPPAAKTDAAPTVAAGGAMPTGQPIAGDSTTPAAMAPPPATAAAGGDLIQGGAGSQAAGAAGMPPGFSMTAPDAAGTTTAPVSVLSGSAANASALASRVPAASSARAAKPTDGAAPIDGTSVKANIAAATSAPTSNDSSAADLGSTTPDGASSPADTGAAAQALMAAAIAQGTSAPTTQSSPPADDLATPDTGAAPQGVLGSSAAPALAMAAAATHSSASIAAAVRAATALSIAQAVSASAGGGAADKHLLGSGPDSSLTGMSTDGTAGAAQLMTSSAATDAPPPPTLKVSAGVDTAEFGQGVGDRVSLMMDSNLTSAKLQVNPPALGPIEVRIALQGGHAQVWFTSHSAVTRDALEASSPKLREMLGAQGFGQVSVDISQRSFQERSPQSHAYEGTPAGRGESSASVQTPGATLRAASGLLDAYA